MRASLGVIASVVLLVGLTAPTALAAPPQRTVIDLNDPALDADESAWWSNACQFPVVADNTGHVIVLSFPGGPRSILELAVYGIRATYTNPATGTSVRLRDIGPDRLYIRDGRMYVGVTGRSTTGTGVIGLVVIDLATGDIVHQAGNDVGLFQDSLCEALAA